MTPEAVPTAEQSPRAVVTGAFVEQGVPVLSPACPGPRYDLVVESEGQFLRVAVVRPAADGTVDASVAREQRDAPGGLAPVDYVAVPDRAGDVFLLHASAFADGAVTPGAEDRLRERLSRLSAGRGGHGTEEQHSCPSGRIQ